MEKAPGHDFEDHESATEAAVEGRHTVIGFANTCIEPRDLLLGRKETYLDLLQDGDFDEEAGIMWSEMRLPVINCSQYSLAHDGLITSLHESFRETQAWALWRVGMDRRSLLEHAKSAIAFPLMLDAYEHLRETQTQVMSGQRSRNEPVRPLPLIVHPDGQWLGDRPPKPRWRQHYNPQHFPDVWLQPTAEWAANRGIPLGLNPEETADLIVEKHLAQKVGGMALDLHHLTTERQGYAFQNPVELAGALASRGTFREVQIAVRPEFGGDPKLARQVYSGHIGATIFGDMLRAINDARPQGTRRIMHEAQAGVVLGSDDTTAPLAERYQQANAGIRELLSA